MSYIDKLFEIVKSECKVSEDEVKSKTREREVVVCRKIIAILLRKENYTISYISKLLNRNHSSIVYFTDCMKFEDGIKYDPLFKRYYNAVVDKLNESKQISE